MAGLRVKKIICCLLIAAVSAAITNCSATMNSNTNSLAATIGTPIPTESLKSTASADNHPLESPSASPVLTSQPTASADSVMISEQNYFKFGMSRKSIEKELRKLGIKIDDEGSANERFDAPNGFYTISTDKMDFELNDQNQLYSITECSHENAKGETTKGLKKGDPVERVQQLYGKPDELKDDVNIYHYIYHCNGYMFSVHIESNNNTVYSWSVFLNIWNDPNSYGITDAMYAGDDLIQFGEENFGDIFTFGMSRKELKQKLTGLGIRIDLEEAPTSLDYAEDEWALRTDHLTFYFDKGGLHTVVVLGWGTAKGLQIGDSIEKLHQLYGQEYSKSGGELGSDYTYKMKGCYFTASFLKNDSGVLGLYSWTVSKW